MRVIAVLTLFVAVSLPSLALPTKGKPPAIAVLPFKVLNAEPQWQHFGEGASDSVINKFVNDKALRIVEEAQLDKAVTALSRNQSGLFEEESALTIGQMVDARFIVIGSVQIVGDQQNGQLKVNARVLEVETRQLLLSEAVYGSINNAFAQYDEIATRLTNRLTAYLAQRVNNNESADEVAVRQLIDEGKQYDPNFPATAGVAKDMARAHALYDRALLRNSKSSKATLALGHVEFRMASVETKDVAKHDRLLKGARDHVRKATDLDGSVPFAWCLLGRIEGTLKNHDAARAAFERALSLDAAFVEARYGLAVSMYNLKQYAAAREQALLASQSGEARADELVHSIDSAMAAQKTKPAAAARR
jgi:adenylate cyclase